MWICETCGSSSPWPSRGMPDEAECLGRRFFGLAIDALLCPLCAEGVRTVGCVVEDLQLPPLCPGCRGNIDRAWASPVGQRTAAPW